MSEPEVQFIRDDRVVVLTIQRPPANAMNLSAMQALQEHLSRLAEDSSVWSIILTGAGEKGFCAGFDLKDGAHAAQMNPLAQQVCNQLESMPKPVIAAINGYALGGGCELAMSCHFRFMVNKDKAVIGLPETELGVIPVWGGTQRLPRLIGRGKALDMMIFSKKIGGEQALQIGLVDKLCDPGQLQEEAMEYAQALATRPPKAVAALMHAVRIGTEQGLDAGLKAELDQVAGLSSSKDAMEGINAFFQKRPPQFTGE
ncbi:MAG TPA: enoyl-CoA hydratase [Gammaproteobacteria bacterium]|nr:enoyl-CoA hydratase [Gammaproteobacteria bacterium]